MAWKTLAILSMGFSAGMAFTVACAGGRGGSGAIGKANAAEGGDSDCAAWEYTVWLTDQDVECVVAAAGPQVVLGEACSVPDGWEPFGGEGSAVMLRRCLD